MDFEESTALAEIRNAVAELRVPDVMDTEQAAAYLGVSAALLEALRVKGGGPKYAKFARLVRYRRVSLDEWLESRERTNTVGGKQ